MVKVLSTFSFGKEVKCKTYFRKLSDRKNIFLHERMNVTSLGCLLKSHQSLLNTPMRNDLSLDHD